MHKRLRHTALSWAVVPAFLALAAGCVPDKPDTLPAGVLSPDTMVAVLVDFHLAQARGQEWADQNDPTGGRERYYRKAFEKHGITYERFKASTDYYSTRPKRFTEIYDKVIEEISRKQAEAAGQKGK